MPYPLTPEAEAAFTAGRMHPVLLLDLYCRDSLGAAQTLRGWNQPSALDYPANDHVNGDDTVTYLDMHGRMQVDIAIKQTASLSSEPLSIILDASRADDDDDFVGTFASSQWHQNRCRVRIVLLDFDTGASPTDPIWEWHGRMDHRQRALQPDAEDQFILSCEGGLFRVRGRRMHTRTHADQQRRAAGDLFFQATPLMATLKPTFGKEPAAKVSQPKALTIRYIPTFKGGSFV